MWFAAVNYTIPRVNCINFDCNCTRVLSKSEHFKRENSAILVSLTVFIANKLSCISVKEI